MTPREFVDKWRASRLTERAASQSHFKDLCRLLGVKEPYEDDPSDAEYCFEKGAAKTGGGDGWADVWKRGCFGWEYKGKHKDLAAALKQLKLYQGALENPPLLIVSDMERIEVHTAWTSMVQETQVFTLDDLLVAEKRALLKKAFSETAVEAFKPGRKRADLTADVARDFIQLAQSLRERKHPPEKVAHFVNRMVFCMFAEDVELLPEKLFTRLLEASLSSPEKFAARAGHLFRQMSKGGELADYTKIEWFNGGLFDDDAALPLTKTDIQLALNAAKQDWSNVDPSIMGTLFERGLDPSKRSQLGAHYTDPEKIMMIVNPVIVEPLSREWEGVKAEIAGLMQKIAGLKKPFESKAYKDAAVLQNGFRKRLEAFRILDPACGSGNFLFLGLKALKDIEHRVNTECEALGLQRTFPTVGPENVLGIEINPFAAELARVSVWIGEIQWMRDHGFTAARDPILKPLETIACHDALLDVRGGEYKWPKTDAIIGNPPFLGDKLMIDAMGEPYVAGLRKRYDRRVPGGADLVCYWFAKAREALEANLSNRVGLVSTNSIRGGANRKVLDDIDGVGEIFAAWSDEPWVVDGAAVRVSIVCFGLQDNHELLLDGVRVDQINSDLSSSETNITAANCLSENSGRAFIGDQKSGPFDVPRPVAEAMLKLPKNPNGKRNSEVLRPWKNGLDVTRRSSERWIIDFGTELTEREAALFEEPFRLVKEYVAPMRSAVRRDGHRNFWWRHGEPRPGMRRSLANRSRYMATPRVAKHRLFVWLDQRILPDCQLVVIARDDDTTFGILHSRLHELWSLRLCTWLGVGNDPRYTPSTTFETFPFPEGLTPNIPAADYASDPRAKAIAAAAKKLNELREAWLNPEDLVRREPEVVAGYPDRILPVSEEAAKELKKRTLTNLYNQRPAWLDHAHRDLDAAVAAAYGWKDWGKDGLSDEAILERLFALNQQRAAAETRGG